MLQHPRQDNPSGDKLCIVGKSSSRKTFLPIAFLFALLFLPSLAISHNVKSFGVVRIGKKTVLLIRKSIGSISPKDRASIVNTRIIRILTDPKLDPSQIRVGQLDKSDTVVKLGEMAIIDVTASDAAAENLSVKQLANEWAERLRKDLVSAKPFYAGRSKLNVKTLGEHHTLLFVLELILLLVMARICGEIMARLKQPPVVGQVIAGIILGRSIFGSLLPNLHELIFPVSATQSYLLQIISWLGSIFLLLIIGLETDIRMIRRQGGIAIWTTIGGIVIPFLLGFVIGVFLPPAFMADTNERWILALYLATLFSVSSVPVVAKLLMEMNLLRRNIGQIILATAMAQDTIGWIMLAVLSGFASGSVFNGFTLAKIICGTILYMLFVLTVGQRLVSSILRWVNNHISGVYPLLTAVILLMFLSAGITQLIGIHAILGSFMIGVILTASPLIKKKCYSSDRSHNDESSRAHLFCRSGFERGPGCDYATTDFNHHSDRHPDGIRWKDRRMLCGGTQRRYGLLGISNHRFRCHGVRRDGTNFRDAGVVHGDPECEYVFNHHFDVCRDNRHHPVSFETVHEACEIQRGRDRSH